MHSYRDRLYDQGYKNQYGDNLAFLWPQYPCYAVFRHNGNQKWYAVMDVPKSKLGIDGDGVIDILNVKCLRENAPVL